MEEEKILEKRKERRKEFLDWDIEKDLPLHVGPYDLERTDEQEGRIYQAFRWIDRSSGWQIKAVFDEETADYMIKIDLKFITFTLIEVISDDFESFKVNVKNLVPAAIEKELIQRYKISVLIKDKGFMNWEYEKLLPLQAGKYRRVIEPKEPVSGLNGSYIIAAYECSERETAMIFFYNVYREEYYGEMQVRGIPIMIHQYDGKTIEEFSKAIEGNLEKDLDYLYGYTAASE